MVTPFVVGVGFEQVPKAQDGALVGQALFAHVQPRELAKQGHVVQRFFHGGIRALGPLLQEVDAQHGLDGKRRTTPFGPGFGRMRGNQRNPLCPGHHPLHLVKKLALAGSPGLALQSRGAQAHLFQVATVSHQARSAEVVQTFPSSSSCLSFGSVASSIASVPSRGISP
jgi:hypothetical protein